ncbi:MAG TPA: methionyl-tRNA formyltransferase [candidate division Zixibacteria bacterium]|nr:methionyl-tRNA formyltransferase [candidate division Zixibacteria bacterium]
MPDFWPIVFMGTPEPAALTLERLLEGPDPVVGVVTQPDRPAGRGQKSTPSPVRKLAESRGIPVIAPEKIRAPEVLETLKKWNPRVVAVVAYGRILPRSILELPPAGCINVHYSLLPKYRGAAPIAWTILNGEREGGVTTIRLVEKMDAGPIYLQEGLELAPDETTSSLAAKLAPIGARLLLETIRGLKEGRLEGQPQDEAQATLAPMIKKEDGLIDWRQPAVAIERRVRAFTPWPSAYTHLRGKLMKIHRARVLTGPSAAPGEVVRADAGGFWVATGDGLLALEEVQLENRKRLPGTEFVKGARIRPGERL